MTSIPGAAASQPTPVELADRVAVAVLAVPGVAGLHSGAFGEVGTHLAGRRVEGVRLGPDRCEVHLVVVWGTDVLVTADRVRAAVAPLVDRVVDVTVEDVVAAVTASGPASGMMRV